MVIRLRGRPAWIDDRAEVGVDRVARSDEPRILFVGVDETQGDRDRGEAATGREAVVRCGQGPLGAPHHGQHVGLLAHDPVRQQDVGARTVQVAEIEDGRPVGECANAVECRTRPWKRREINSDDVLGRRAGQQRQRDRNRKGGRDDDGRYGSSGGGYG